MASRSSGGSLANHGSSSYEREAAEESSLPSPVRLSAWAAGFRSRADWPAIWLFDESPPVEAPPPLVAVDELAPCWGCCDWPCP